MLGVLGGLFILFDCLLFFVGWFGMFGWGVSFPMDFLGLGFGVWGVQFGSVVYIVEDVCFCVHVCHMFGSFWP